MHNATPLIDLTIKKSFNNNKPLKRRRFGVNKVRRFGGTTGGTPRKVLPPAILKKHKKALDFYKSQTLRSKSTGTDNINSDAATCNSSNSSSNVIGTIKERFVFKIKLGPDGEPIFFRTSPFGWNAIQSSRSQTPPSQVIKFFQDTWIEKQKKTWRARNRSPIQKLSRAMVKKLKRKFEQNVTNVQ